MVLSPMLAPPSAPANLTAIPTNLQINLNWNPVNGATNYTLKRGTANGGPYPTICRGLTATNYADANVTNTVTYYYVVTALGAGGESSNSVQAAAAPLPSKQPTSISASLSSGRLALSWPFDHIGWRLQAQTNGLNPANWVEVPGATATNLISIEVDPANWSVFYRMVYSP